MQLRFDPTRPERLSDQLTPLTRRQPLASIWAIAGADPLLSDEAAGTVRLALQALGFTERSSDTPDRSFDWRDWISQAKSASLFGDKKLLELRLPTGKPGAEGGKVLTVWAAEVPHEAVLLLRLPRIDKTLGQTAWFKALCDQGVLISIPDLSATDLPHWIRLRMEALGLQAEASAIQWLASRCEGNLVAAHQEIQKLAYLPREDASRPILLAEMQTATTDQARFNPFQLGETLVAGDARRSLRVLRGLREEGEPLPLLVWSVAQACRRLPTLRARPALETLAAIDTMAKGLSPDDPWVALEQLALDLARPMRRP